MPWCVERTNQDMFVALSEGGSYKGFEGRLLDKSEGASLDNWLECKDMDMEHPGKSVVQNTCYFLSKAGKAKDHTALGYNYFVPSQKSTVKGMAEGLACYMLVGDLDT